MNFAIFFLLFLSFFDFVRNEDGISQLILGCEESYFLASDEKHKLESPLECGQDRFGNERGAFIFDGESSIIQQKELEWGTSSSSMGYLSSFWFKIDTEVTDYSLLEYSWLLPNSGGGTGSSSGDERSTISVGSGCIGGNPLSISLSATGPSFDRKRCLVMLDYSQWERNRPDDGNWHHFVLWIECVWEFPSYCYWQMAYDVSWTHEADKTKIEENEEAIIKVSEYPFPPIQDVVVGRDFEGGEMRFFKGRMDDLHFQNYVRGDLLHSGEFDYKKAFGEPFGNILHDEMNSLPQQQLPLESRPVLINDRFWRCCAFKFDGVDDLYTIDVPSQHEHDQSGFNLQSNYFSISFWINLPDPAGEEGEEEEEVELPSPRNVVGYPVLCDVGDDGEEGGGGLPQAFVIMAIVTSEGDKTKMYFEFTWWNTDGTRYFIAPKQSTFTLNTWHNVLVTAHGKLMTLWVDGLKVGELKFSGSVRQASSPAGDGNNNLRFTFGHCGNFGAERSSVMVKSHLSGAIDDLKLYNRPVTQHEIETFEFGEYNPDLYSEDRDGHQEMEEMGRSLWDRLRIWVALGTGYSAVWMVGSTVLLAGAFVWWIKRRVHTQRIRKFVKREKMKLQQKMKEESSSSTTTTIEVVESEESKSNSEECESLSSSSISVEVDTESYASSNSDSTTSSSASQLDVSETES